VRSTTPHAPRRSASTAAATANRSSTLDEIGAGEGGVVEHGKRKLAVWKEDDGRPHEPMEPARLPAAK
jgi:hypothetical protein